MSSQKNELTRGPVLRAVSQTNTISPFIYSRSNIELRETHQDIETLENSLHSRFTRIDVMKARIRNIVKFTVFLAHPRLGFIISE